ncbi:hypothetical protein BCR44DRAFT_34512 [Catenaria anguillulae PL171]|uniref:Uncharacterized protein n=1 Tax=Catenaria anguillulae PL171 TaxID=765915 RepID=A0A1Y2I6T9_9FUNG|nr:hypothetical protein BCR44DRAFT_34512 [Catenaria anguillulae PL171]
MLRINDDALPFVLDPLPSLMYPNVNLHGYTFNNGTCRHTCSLYLIQSAHRTRYSDDKMPCSLTLERRRILALARSEATPVGPAARIKTLESKGMRGKKLLWCPGKERVWLTGYVGGRQNSDGKFVIKKKSVRKNGRDERIVRKPTGMVLRSSVVEKEMIVARLVRLYSVKLSMSKMSHAKHP